jgi:hypothetical protein
MDSDPKTRIGIPQAEMPPISFDEGRARRTNRWLVGAVVVLALLVVALGVALIAASGEGTAPPSGVGSLAPPKIVQAIDAHVAAWNARDEEAYAATWAENAVFTRGGLETVGVDEIVASLTQRPTPDDWRIERTSEVVFVPRLSRSAWGGRVADHGPYAAHSFTCVNGTGPSYTYAGIAVYVFDEGSKIVHKWVMNPSEKWVTGMCN